MREGWEMTRLGRLLTLRRSRPTIDPQAIYKLVTLAINGNGARLRKEVRGSELGTARFDVRHGDLMVSKIDARKGASALLPKHLDGAIVTGDFLSFEVNESLVAPAFLDLWVRRHEFAELADTISSGTTNRVRMDVHRFPDLRIPLPPLAEQRRIVDLIGSLDAVIAAAEGTEQAARETRSYLLEALLTRLPSETDHRPMGDVGEFIRGRRFVKSDYVEDGLGCIHYGQIYTHYGSVTTETLTFIPEAMRPRMRLASKGDVVIAATSENIEDVGKATAWMGEDDVAVHDDCQIFRHQLDPTFAAHLFASENFQRQKIQYAAGTKVTRLSGDSLAKIAVPVPAREYQESIGRTMSDLDMALENTTKSVGRLRDLRSNLLTVLLSGEHEIPESYDELWEAGS